MTVKADHADVYETSGGKHYWRDAGDNARQYKKGGALTDVAHHIHKGGLHKSLGIPQGEKIPAKRIAAATHSDNLKVRRQANLAKTFAKYRPG